MFLNVIHINNYGSNVESISKTICVVLCFQKGRKICEILVNAMCSGSILMYVLILWLWIVLVLLYRVQGHAWSHTLYGIVIYETLKFEKHYFIYHLILLNSFFPFTRRNQRHSEFQKRPDKTCWQTAFVTETTIIRRMSTAKWVKGKCMRCDIRFYRWSVQYW